MPTYSMFVKNPKLICIRYKNCGTEAYTTKEVLKIMKYTCRNCRSHRYEKVA